MTNRKYTDEQLAFVKQRSRMNFPDLVRTFNETFGYNLSHSAMYQLRIRKGWSVGRHSGAYHGGNHPAYMPAGSERVNCNGYVERKIDGGSYARGRWKLAHRLEWEDVNGPIPRGMVLKCKSDRANIDPSNWEMVPLAVQLRLNGIGQKRVGRPTYDRAPDEMKPTLMALAKLEHAVLSRVGKAAEIGRPV